MLPNYIQYRYDLFRQKRSAKALEKTAPLDCEESRETGALQEYFRREELSEQWRALIQTDYYRRKAESLLIDMPDTNDPTMYSRVGWEDHPDEPYYLTPAGLKVVKATVREEQKHRREAVGYWFGILVGLIGAITGLVSVFNG